jgi:mannosyl-oligosaccharide alpha-1,3-glucosidase
MYSFENFEMTTHQYGAWIDMNEPSVFNVEDGTMPRGNLHANGTIMHRDVHNLYGRKMQECTFRGLMNRSPHQRPFVLTRSFWFGSSKYGAVWTGDNSEREVEI